MLQKTNAAAAAAPLPPSPGPAAVPFPQLRSLLGQVIGLNEMELAVMANMCGQPLNQLPDNPDINPEVRGEQPGGLKGAPACSAVERCGAAEGPKVLASGVRSLPGAVGRAAGGHTH